MTPEYRQRVCDWLTLHGVDPAEVAETATFDRAETGHWRIANPPDIGGVWTFTEKVPYPKEPRTWSLPAEPGPEVTAVRDAGGRLWQRGCRERDLKGAWVVRHHVTGHVELARRHWSALLVEFAPLTDATEEARHDG